LCERRLQVDQRPFTCVPGNASYEQSNEQHSKPINHNSLKIKDRRGMQRGIKESFELLFE